LLDVIFRDVKQFLGLEEPRNGVAKATAKRSRHLYLDLVLLWHAKSGHLFAPQSAIERLWYNVRTSVLFGMFLEICGHLAGKGFFATTRLDAQTRKSFNRSSTAVVKAAK
jgi:hypothetical protein